MVDEYEAFDGMRIGKGAKIILGNLPQCHFVHREFHMS
jgi:hypothetical protein